MKSCRLYIALGLIGVGSMLSLLAHLLPYDLLFWLRLPCYVTALALSVQEVTAHVFKKKSTSARSSTDIAQNPSCFVKYPLCFFLPVWVPQTADLKKFFEKSNSPSLQIHFPVVFS